MASQNRSQSPALSAEQISALFANAQSFFAAAQLTHANVIETNERPTLAHPLIVLLAFSAELALKALIALDDPSARFAGPTGHDLRDLFNRMSVSDRQSLLLAAQKPQPPYQVARTLQEVHDCLDRDRSAFRQWRYSHEATNFTGGTDMAVLAAIARHCLDLYAGRQPGARLFALPWPPMIRPNWS